jgi:hypothetical protein
MHGGDHQWAGIENKARRVINGKVCWMQGQFTQLFSVAVDPLVWAIKDRWRMGRAGGEAGNGEKHATGDEKHQRLNEDDRITIECM